MNYEKPIIEKIIFDREDIIFTSIKDGTFNPDTEGGISGEGF